MRYSSKQISKALLAANRLLKRDVRPVAKVAAVLNRYMDCTEIEGVSGQPQADIKSAIFAVMGDAYRREGNVELAAKWYRRASLISPGVHAAIYAHLVCKNQLAEFYDDALRTLHEHQGRWLAKPVLSRFLLRALAWTNPEAREIARSEKRDLAFLLQHALAKAASDPSSVDMEMT